VGGRGGNFWGGKSALKTKLRWLPPREVKARKKRGGKKGKKFLLWKRGKREGGHKAR